MYTVRIKKLFVWLLLCMSFLLLTSCEQKKEDDSNFPVVIKNITLYGEPESIVSLSDSITKTLQELELSNKIIAVNSDCEIKEFTKLSHVGTDEQPNLNKMKELKADLLITNCSLSTKTMNQLSENGIKVLILSKNTSEYSSQLQLLKGKVQKS